VRDNVFHGFVRDREGTFTTFDAKDAGASCIEGTQPYGINPGRGDHWIVR
jgi:hypothetical protein